MGWLIAVAVTVFIGAVFLFTLALCMAAGDEDDDAEQMKWLQEIEEKRRKRKNGRDLH